MVEIVIDTSDPNPVQNAIYMTAIKEQERSLGVVKCQDMSLIMPLATWKKFEVSNEWRNYIVNWFGSNDAWKRCFSDDNSPKKIYGFPITIDSRPEWADKDNHIFLVSPQSSCIPAQLEVDEPVLIEDLTVR